MFYWKVCLTGGQILLEAMSCKRALLIAGHVEQQHMSNRSTRLTLHLSMHLQPWLCVTMCVYEFVCVFIRYVCVDDGY